MASPRAEGLSREQSGDLRLLVSIPALNEERTVGEVVRGVPDRLGAQAEGHDWVLLHGRSIAPPR